MAPETPLRRLRARIEQWIGLDLSQRESELERWLKARSAGSEPDVLAERLSSASSPDSPDAAELIHRFTVSYTRFFRDAEQLAAVEAALTALQRPLLRIWVAGCSTGEEAYTMALIAQSRGLPVEIVGSDVNSQSLAVARAGRYPKEALATVPPQYHGDLRPCGEAGELIEPSSRVRRRVSFVQHNLLQAPLKPDGAEGFDLIMCRNVVIYFRPELAAETLKRLGSALLPSGYLLLGVSEFHLGSPGLVPARFADRILLQRPSRSVPVTSPATSSSPTLPPVPSPSSPELRSGGAAPGSPKASLAVGLLLGRLDAVLGETLPVLIRDPESQPALFLAGVAYHLKGRHHEATALLDKTRSQHPTCWPATYFWAVSMDVLGRTQEARAAYRALALNPPTTPEAQALVDLVDLQQWKSEALAQTRRRLGRPNERITLVPLRPSSSKDLEADGEDANVEPPS
jgi:chemotaxis protein methyltransferase CheR